MSQILVEEGIKACQSDNFEKGVTLFTKALTQNPQDLSALYNRARAYSKLHQLAKALDDFKQLVLLQPTNATFIGDYAVALHLNKNDDEAKIQFDKALALEPENPYRWSSRAFFKDRIGESQSALKDYDKAIELDPEDAIALNNRGLIEEKLGYIEKSKNSFNRSNKLVGYDPDKSQKSAPKSRPNISAKEQEEEKLTRWKVIKSVFTKEGFRDFGQFYKNRIFGSKD